MRSSNIGGQAVMEGIMMRHKDKYSIAVRRPDNGIELKVEDYKCTFGNAKFLKYPLIRGVVSFVDSLVVGTKCLMYSAEIAGDEEDEEEAEKNAALSEEERKAKEQAEAEQRSHMTQAMASPEADEHEPVLEKMIVKFEVELTTDDAVALRDFFQSRGIVFRAI